MVKISKELFELIKTNLGVDFLKELLLIRNRVKLNSFQNLQLNKYTDLVKSLEVLEILLEVVGKDRGFFIRLTRQFGIPKEISEFLKTNLEIKQPSLFRLLVDDLTCDLFIEY
jgi:hypothetical protein